MFDNLRDLADEPLYEDEQNDLYTEPELSAEPVAATPARRKRKRRNRNNFLGMTAQQRLLVAVMLMFATCILGTLVMFAMDKMSLF